MQKASFRWDRRLTPNTILPLRHKRLPTYLYGKYRFGVGKTCRLINYWKSLRLMAPSVTLSVKGKRTVSLSARWSELRAVTYLVSVAAAACVSPLVRYDFILIENPEGKALAL